MMEESERLLRMEIKCVLQTLHEKNVEIRAKNQYITDLLEKKRHLQRETHILEEKNAKDETVFTDYILRYMEQEEKLKSENEKLKENIQEKNVEIRAKDQYITDLLEKKRHLPRETHILEEKNAENEKKINETHMAEKEELIRENQSLKETIQELRSGDIIRQLNDYVKDLEERSERECAIHRRVMAEKEQLQVEKDNIVTVVRRQSEESQFLNRRITQLEEQLKVNKVARAVCIVFGYSREMVMKAFVEWEKRHGCKAADLMEILMEMNGESQAPHDEGQMVNEVNQRDDRKANQLEGAVGGKVCPELSMDLLIDDNVAEHRTADNVEDENHRIVAPSGCPYREYFG